MQQSICHFFKPSNGSKKVFQSNVNFHRKVIKLNQTQFDIANHFLFMLSYGSSPIRLQIQGAAGTGKSFLISKLVSIAEQVYECNDPLYPTVLKISPTGLSASNIGGITVHSAFGLTIGKINVKMSKSSFNKLRLKMHNVAVIIVDEMSMVSLQMLTVMDERLKEIKSSKLPFGGVHIVCLGDFYQLPPVGGTRLYSSQYNNPFNDFQFMELTEIMRQKDDVYFAKLLSDLANERLDQNQINYLKSRIITGDRVPPLGAMMIYYTNSEVDAANKRRLKDIEGELTVVEAQDVVLGECTESERMQLLDIAKTTCRRNTCNLMSKLELKIGARYMLTHNIDVQDGLVNGLTGILRFIETSETEVTRLWLEPNDPNIGKNIRKKFDNEGCVPIEKMKKSISINTKRIEKKAVYRIQFPVVVAEAVTVYKSQGATFSNVIVGKMPLNNPFASYVAFSRVTSGDGLFIENLVLPKPRKSDDDLVQWLERKRSDERVPIFRFLREKRIDSPLLQIMYHNVKSVLDNVDEIRNDYCFTNSDVLFLTGANDTNVSIHEFGEPFHSNGLSIYFKEHLTEVKAWPNIVSVQLNNLVLCLLFAQEGSSTQDLMKQVKEMLIHFLGLNNQQTIVLIGDFEEPSKGIELTCAFEELELNIVFNSISKAICTSTSGLLCGEYVSSFGKGKPLFLFVDKD